MYPYAAPSYLITVERNIVSLGAHIFGLRIKKLYIFLHHHREGMVHRKKPVLLVRPLKQRELRYPEEFVFVRSAKSKLVGYLES